MGQVGEVQCSWGRGTGRELATLDLEAVPLSGCVTWASHLGFPGCGAHVSTVRMVSCEVVCGTAGARG